MGFLQVIQVLSTVQWPIDELVILKSTLDVNDCRFCQGSPDMNLQLVQGAPHLLPKGSWDWLQPSMI